MAVEVRNNLIFGLTGGAGQLPPTHELKIGLSGTQTQNVIVDITTARTDMEIYGIDATYTLTESCDQKDRPDRPRVRARVLRHSRPGAALRPRRAASATPRTAASAIIADQIKSRLASYFVTGG